MGKTEIAMLVAELVLLLVIAAQLALVLRGQRQKQSPGPEQRGTPRHGIGGS